MRIEDVEKIARVLENSLRPYIEVMVKEEAGRIREEVRKKVGEMLEKGIEEAIRKKVEKEIEIVVEVYRRGGE